MAEGLAARQRTLTQREARRAHRQTVASLQAELAAVRRETTSLAAEVNELRHEVRRSQHRLAQPPVWLPSPPPHATTSAAAADADMRLTAARRQLIGELLHLQQEVWRDIGVEEQMAQLQAAAAQARDAEGSSFAANGLPSGSGGGLSGEAGSGGGGGGGTTAASLSSLLSSSFMGSNEGDGSFSRGIKLSLPSQLIPAALIPSQFSDIAYEMGLGAHPSSVPPEPSPESPTLRLARDMGHVVLLVSLCASYLSLHPLPFKLVFEGSSSFIWHPGTHRALRLSSQKGSAAEGSSCTDDRQASALLEANVRYLLRHVAEPSSHAPTAEHAADGVVDGGTRARSEGSGGSGDSSSSSRRSPGVGAVMEQLGQLLTARSLAWELHAERSPLWRHQDSAELPLVQNASHGNSDEWAVVERPAVPTPWEADDVHLYEASVPDVYGRRG